MLGKDFFTPQSVAVVGASNNPDKIGYALVKNILESGYRGEVYPVNPGESEVLSLACYPGVTDLPRRVDMALIAVSWQAVFPVLDDCAARGIKRLVMISAGFKEAGEHGSRLEKELLKALRKHGMRLLGPNCLGFINTSLPINATFASGVFPSGDMSLVAQSGAMRQSYWDWSRESGLGLNRFISLGNEADITESDVLEMLKDDDQTRVIIAYLEGIADGERFRRVAGSLTPVKPLIVLKAGITSSGSKMARSHTGSMAGADEVYDAVFKQTGIIRARSPEQLFDFAFGLSCQPLLSGERLAVVTNAGGPGVTASDAIERAGLRLARLARDTVSSLRGELPSFASLNNPIDLTGTTTPDNYERVLRIVLSDRSVDGVLTILCPQGPLDVAEIAGAVVRASRGCGKPVFTNFMGAGDHRPELAALRENGIPNYPSPERAVDGFRAMHQYRLWLKRRREVAVTPDYDRHPAQAVLQGVEGWGVKTAGGLEALRVLEAYGFRSPRAGVAKSIGEAERLAGEIGYPLVMKVVSPDIIHKTEFGGVRLGVSTPEAVASAYAEITESVRRLKPEAKITGVMVQAMTEGREVILGLKRDPQFGAAIMFGLGGIYTEVLKDVSFRVAPITPQDARDMISEIRGLPLLTGARGGKKADIEAIARCLVGLSQLALDFPQIVELDINPLMVDEPGKGAVAVDCRLALK
jgi:acetyl coenzyme A synthetase (ADP forming)-like protein